MNGETCMCGRPRSTAEDLARWEREKAAHIDAGGDEKTFNPDWSRVMCWTKPEYADKCMMRPLAKETSNV